MREPRMGSRCVLRALTALALVIAPFHLSIDGPVATKAFAGKGGNGNGNGGNGNGNGGGNSGGNGNGNSGGNNGNGNSGNSNSGGNGKGNSASKASATVDHVNTVTGDKVEVNGKSIKVTHPNGMKEEIENGRFRMEDALGRTIVDRAATAADMARLKSL